MRKCEKKNVQSGKKGSRVRSIHKYVHVITERSTLNYVQMVPATKKQRCRRSGTVYNFVKGEREEGGGEGEKMTR